MRSGAASRLGRSLAFAAPLLLATTLSALAATKHGVTQMAPLNRTIEALIPFRNAPFPYSGIDPETQAPFFDVEQDGRRGRTSLRGGGIYWQDTTYSDNRVLLALPPGFDLARPAALVVFLHGNHATLEDDVVGRQQVLAQFIDSGLNAALVAPQLAVNALDSSAGGFWMPKTFARFLSEAAEHLGDFYKDAPAAARASFGKLPVVIVAYSGGYDPAAYALAVGGAGKRVIGVILLDAAFGQTDKFVDWVVRNHRHAFFFSGFSESSAAGNAAIEAGLSAEHVEVAKDMPQALVPGSVNIVPVEGAGHEDFITNAWIDRPLAWLLARIPGFSRHGPSPAKQVPEPRIRP
jgi:hypothetical protein